MLQVTDSRKANCDCRCASCRALTSATLERNPLKRGVAALERRMRIPENRDVISNERRIEYVLGFLILGMISEAKEELDAITSDEWSDEVALLRTEIEGRMHPSGQGTKKPKVTRGLRASRPSVTRLVRTRYF